METMKRAFLIIPVLLLNALLATGQELPASAGKDVLQRLREKEVTGQVVVQMDSLVEANYYKLLVLNYKNRGISGYRIRIFSDNGTGAKDNQKRTRAKFLSLYPEIPVYYRYEGSYYKVYIGDFRTKADAMKFLDEIKRNFADAFIVEDDIIIQE